MYLWATQRVKPSPRYVCVCANCVHTRLWEESSCNGFLLIFPSHFDVLVVVVIVLLSARPTECDWGRCVVNYKSHRVWWYIFYVFFHALSVQFFLLHWMIPYAKFCIWNVAFVIFFSFSCFVLKEVLYARFSLPRSSFIQNTKNIARLLEHQPNRLYAIWNYIPLGFIW